LLGEVNTELRDTMEAYFYGKYILMYIIIYKYVYSLENLSKMIGLISIARFYRMYKIYRRKMGIKMYIIQVV
jgi:hypothetical protein